MYQNRKSPSTWSVAAGAAIALLCTSGLRAQNEGFEPPFAPNASNAIGDVGLRASYQGIDPTQGANQLLLTTINNISDGASSGGPSNQSGTNAAASTSLATFLGVSTGTLRDGPDNIAQEGSAFRIELTLQIGQIVTFDYQFITQEDFFVTPFQGDFAFITLTLGGALQQYTVIDSADNANANTPDPGVFSFTPAGGQKTFTYIVTTAGTYTLGIGVADAATTDIPSGLLVDNITVIPEPSTYALAFAGLGLLLGIQRMRRSA